MLSPYRAAARPPAPTSSPNRALAHVVRWLPGYAALVSALAPVAVLPGHPTADATGLVLAYVFGAALSPWAPTWPWPRIQHKVTASLLLSAFVVFVTTGLYWGSPKASPCAPLPPVRVVPRGERILLPHGAIVRYGDVRVKILGGATLILHGAAARCLPPYGPIEENVMYTPDCDREAE